MVCFPQYHKLVKFVLKPIKEHLFLWEGGEVEELIPPQVHQYNSANLLQDVFKT